MNDGTSTDQEKDIIEATSKQFSGSGACENATKRIDEGQIIDHSDEEW